MLASALRERAALATEDELECRGFVVPEKAAECLKSQGASVIGWDMSDEPARQRFCEVRGCCRDAFLLVLASRETSPLTFLRPEIAPGSLIIRPLTKEEVRRAAREMMEAALREADEDTPCFLIQNRDMQKRIPYGDIYYFEARGKKMFARLRSEELGFAGSLERLEADLPQEFQRCHRGFIVNMTKIEEIQLTQNQICLFDGLWVPLSRGYKRVIKERSHG